ncbi:DUF2683 family protein [Candidatus Woesearchaeota archaeon]|nr:DUF2683 family protein [Candidatus Woesearchaeota archaeon]
MPQARLELKEYTVRVLDVIKGKYGLKNRSEALDKLTLEAGAVYVEPVANELALREIDAIYEYHKKHNRNRKLTDIALRKLLRV